MTQTPSAQPAADTSVKPEELRALAASLKGQPLAPPHPPEAPPGPPPPDTATPPASAESPETTRRASAPKTRLGEELPIFCERCGYALHGLPQSRCDRCTILHFSCPECGHHQPINTLRPAAQRIIGRVRAFVLGLWVFFKLNFFGWLLFAWFAMGIEWGYHYNSRRVGANNYVTQMVPREVDIEAIMAFSIFALAFGMFGRMMLLRWRRGVAVGAVLGGLVMAASYFGAMFRGYIDAPRNTAVVMPVGDDFQMLLLGTGLTVTLAAVIVWPIWTALAHLFLPTRTANAVLDWQRDRWAAAPALAREK